MKRELFDIWEQSGYRAIHPTATPKYLEDIPAPELVQP
jgi:hypothetical protein